MVNARLGDVEKPTENVAVSIPNEAALHFLGVTSDTDDNDIVNQLIKLDKISLAKYQLGLNESSSWISTRVKWCIIHNNIPSKIMTVPIGVSSSFPNEKRNKTKMREIS